jgi:hypothetical protein
VSTSSPKTVRRSSWIFAIAAAAIAAVIAAVLVVPQPANATAVLSGRVTSISGAALSGVKVTILDPVQSNGSPGISGVSNSSGVFTLPGVASGEYTLHFDATATTYEQYFGGTADLKSGGLFEVADAGTHQAFIVAALASAGTIKGTVKNTSKSALKGITVYAWSQNADDSWSVKRSGTSSSTGSYSISGLEPGAYKLEARGGAAAKGSARYSGKSMTLAGASSVVVAAAKSATYNFTLGKAGTVTGAVTGAIDPTHSESLKNVVVTPYLLAGTPGAWTSATQIAVAATTNSTGRYAIAGLAPGTYALEFAPPTTAPLPASSIIYDRTFLGGQTSPLLSTTVTVADGHTVSGRNITLHPSGSISGTVLYQGVGTPVFNVRVVLDYAGADILDGHHTPRSTITDVDGHYSFEGVAAGSWDIHAGSVVDSDSTDGINESLNLQRTKYAGINVAQGQSVVFDPSVPIRPSGANTPTADPVISGASPLVPGSALSVDPGTWLATDANTTYTYQWIRKNVPISGETSSTYTVTPGDVSNSIGVIVSVHDYSLGVRSVQTYAGWVSVAPAPAPTVAPSIAGTLEIGQTLSADFGSWPLGNLAIQSSWAVSHDGISWTYLAWNEPTFTLDSNAAYLGDHVKFDYVAKQFGYSDATGSSAVEIYTDGTFVNMSPPVVKKSGSTYSIGKQSVWNAPTNLIQNEWTVVNSDGSTYSFSNAATQTTIAGKPIVLRQFAYYNNITTGTVTVIAQLGSPLVPTGSTVIVGPVAVGSVATAPTFSWPQSPDSITYEWQYLSGAKYKAIGGATASTFIPTAAQKGKMIRVIVTAHSFGFSNRVVASPRVVVASGDMLVPAVNPSAIGTLTPGQNIGIDAGTWTPAATSYTYRWYWSANPAGGPFSIISSAKSANYVPSTSLRGKYLFATVAAAASGTAADYSLSSSGSCRPEITCP